jgi:hypothetical protein
VRASRLAVAVLVGLSCGKGDGRARRDDAALRRARVEHADRLSAAVAECERRVAETIARGVAIPRKDKFRTLPAAPLDRATLAGAPVIAHEERYVNVDAGRASLAAEQRWPVPEAASSLLGPPGQRWCPVLAARSAQIQAADTPEEIAAFLTEVERSPPVDDAPPPVVAVQYWDGDFRCLRAYDVKQEGFAGCLGRYDVRAALVWVRVADGAVLAGASGRGAGGGGRGPRPLTEGEFHRLNGAAEQAAREQALAELGAVLAGW